MTYTPNTCITYIIIVCVYCAMAMSSVLGIHERLCAVCVCVCARKFDFAVYGRCTSNVIRILRSSTNDRGLSVTPPRLSSDSMTFRTVDFAPSVIIHDVCTHHLHHLDRKPHAPCRRRGITNYCILQVVEYRGHVSIVGSAGQLPFDVSP